MKSRVSSSAVHRVRSNAGSVSSGSCRRSAASCRYTSSIRACLPSLSSDQSSRERANVSGSWGSGTTAASQPRRANSSIRPFAVASASSGSSWEVKNWNGVDAAHSSPWNSIGVNGPVSVSSAAQASWSSSRESTMRSPTARLPTWSWFCAHTTSRHDGIAAVSIGAPWSRPRYDEYVPSWKNPRSHTLASADSGSKSASHPVVSPGEGDVHRVVEVVAPLPVEPVPARLARRDELRVVEVGLRDQRQRPPLVGRQRGHLDRHLLEQVHVGGVAEGVHGVDPQTVDVVVRPATSGRCRG